MASPGASEVLLRVVAVGHCHSDLHKPNGDAPIPRNTGHAVEAVDVVEAVCSNFKPLERGDRLIAMSAFDWHRNNVMAAIPIVATGARRRTGDGKRRGIPFDRVCSNRCSVSTGLGAP